MWVYCTQMTYFPILPLSVSPAADQSGQDIQALEGSLVGLVGQASILVLQVVVGLKIYMYSKCPKISAIFIHTIFVQISLVYAVVS